tara:strand:+ start:1154 stop:1747 length:594 start_codon:yes stop_codon:yes gene_type:complete
MKFLRKTKYYEGVVYEWNLPSGFTCPFALECLVKVDRHTGKFDNRSSSYRCYSAMQERFPAVRDHRWKNFDYVRDGCVLEIPSKAEAVRIHMSGDFYSQEYFDMWLDVCRGNPSVEFWAYTKSLPYWANRIDNIPDNLILTASQGGKHDHLIDELDLKNVEVIKSEEEANGRPIDTCDDQARIPNVNFCLLDNFAKT